MNDVKALADRYVAIWNEPDAHQRRGMISDLWADDGVHILQPPQEMRDAATSLGLAARLEARGHDQLEIRVARAYEDFVAPGGFAFRGRGNAVRLRDLIRFNWEMVSTSNGDLAAVGLELLLLDDAGRIAADYQFIES